jgi:cyclic pyranopterin phosphate synthase
MPYICKMASSPSDILWDRHGRFHDYLRISLTDACNLRCVYCMPQEQMQFMPQRHLMSAEEILYLAGLFAAHGVRKIRLTGGEPLVRRDAATIIRKLGALPVQLAMTTNGVLLERYLEDLKAAGMQSINISLDSLREDVNFKLTRRKELQTVRAIIERMAQDGFRIKVNMVVMRGINEFEVPDFVAWSRELPLHIRFIEYMPFDGNQWSPAGVITRAQILEILADHFDFYKLHDGPNDTARAWQVRGFAGTFGVISTMSEPFCSTCNRIRLTADGKLKNCLFSRGETDLLTPLRAGEDVEPLIRDTILAKHARLGGQWTSAFEEIDPAKLQNRSMIRIGG